MKAFEDKIPVDADTLDEAGRRPCWASRASNYVTLTGRVESIDPVFRTLQIAKEVVPFEDLVEVSGDEIVEINAYLGIVDE